MSIPQEAIEAAASVLLGFTGECTCHEGYTGRRLIDPECAYHIVPNVEAAQDVLEAAAPFIRAQAMTAVLALAEEMEKQPPTEIGTIPAIGRLIRATIEEAQDKLKKTPT